MASAEDYANWIVANPGKKGTPEFETVAQAYRAAKGATAPAVPDESTVKRVIGGAVEPNLSLLSGMFAQPVAGLAGLATGAGNALGLTNQSPADMVEKVRGALTYEPRTQGGKDASSVIGYLPEKLGELADRTGGAVSDMTDSPAIGAIVNTMMNAAPAALGVKGVGPRVGVLGDGASLPGIADATSRSLYQSALKPPLNAVRSGDATRAIETLRDEGVNVSPAGAEKIAGRVDDVNSNIADAISSSKARVSKALVANRLQDLIQQAEKQVNPNSDVAAITKAYDEFANHPSIPNADMSVQLAQDMKKGTYRQLKDKYGEMGSADTEAQKTLARGLKEEIASAVPEVGPLNAEESQLLNAKNLLDRRVAVSGNSNPLGLAAPIAHGPAGLLASLLDRSDAFKSSIARKLNPGDLGNTLGDMPAVAMTAPQTFSDDVQKRRAIIAALMGARQ